MEAIKTILEYERIDKVESITFELDHKRVNVQILSNTDWGNTVRPDLIPIWSSLTTIEKTAIKKFIKLISSAALEVSEGDITGDFLS